MAYLDYILTGGRNSTDSLSAALGAINAARKQGVPPINAQPLVSPIAKGPTPTPVGVAPVNAQPLVSPIAKGPTPTPQGVAPVNALPLASPLFKNAAPPAAAPSLGDQIFSRQPLSPVDPAAREMFTQAMANRQFGSGRLFRTPTAALGPTLADAVPGGQPLPSTADLIAGDRTSSNAQAGDEFTALRDIFSGPVGTLKQGVTAMRTLGPDMQYARLGVTPDTAKAIYGSGPNEQTVTLPALNVPSLTTPNSALPDTANTDVGMLNPNYKPESYLGDITTPKFDEFPKYINTGLGNALYDPVSRSYGDSEAAIDSLRSNSPKISEASLNRTLDTSSLFTNMVPGMGGWSTDPISAGRARMAIAQEAAQANDTGGLLDRAIKGALAKGIGVKNLAQLVGARAAISDADYRKQAAYASTMLGRARLQAAQNKANLDLLKLPFEEMKARASVTKANATQQQADTGSGRLTFDQGAETAKRENEFMRSLGDFATATGVITPSMTETERTRALVKLASRFAGSQGGTGGGYNFDPLDVNAMAEYIRKQEAGGQ